MTDNRSAPPTQNDNALIDIFMPLWLVCDDFFEWDDVMPDREPILDIFPHDLPEDLSDALADYIESEE